jgi:hypothetical protein
MALKKLKEVKGIECDYWRIFRNDQNTTTNTTCVRLALYPSQEIREKDVMNYLETQSFIFDGIDYTRDELYAKIKESKMELVSEAVEAVKGKEAVTEMQTVVIQSASEEVYDEEGHLLEEAKEEITEKRLVIIEPAVETVEGKEAIYKETNWFVDAEDC